jgi:psp operon transcriptional activator
LFRREDPQSAVDNIIFDPFVSPFTDEVHGILQPVAREEPQSIEEDFHARIQRVKEQLLRESLKRNGHNQRRTAAALGLSYDQMRGMMRKYKITRPDS